MKHRRIAHAAAALICALAIALAVHGLVRAAVILLIFAVLTQLSSLEALRVVVSTLNGKPKP